MKSCEYEYSAFISYSHSDIKLTKWLQKQLESYIISKDLQEDLDLQKHLKKCFRDEDDLSGTALKESLFKEMDKSQFLILVCSPKSAKSVYVNDEVENFCKIRGKEFILPFIIDGTPNSDDPQNECFPKALKEAYHGFDSPLGYDIRSLGKVKIISKIVATLLNIPADYLIKRDLRKKKKLRIRNSIIATILGLFSIYTACFALYCMPHSANYVDYVFQKGEPIGINKLTKNEISQKSYHYSITSKYTPVDFGFWSGSTSYEISIKNSFGTIIQEEYKPDSASTISCVFSNNGQYSRTLIDKQGNAFAKYKYSDDMLAMDITNPNSDSQAVLLSSDTLNSDSFALGEEISVNSNISRKCYSYDQNGFVTKVLYMSDNRNRPVCDSNGIYGEEYVLDNYGRIVEKYFLDIDGEKFATSYGIYCVKYSYDENGMLLCAKNLNIDGQAIVDSEKNAIINYEYDDNMNKISTFYTDINGENVICKNYYHKTVCKYENGILTNIAYYGLDNNLVICDTNVAQIEKIYNQNGFLIQENFFDKNGKVCLFLNIAASRTFEYDEFGNLTKLALWKEDGSPALFYDSWHCTVYEYNENGQKTKVAKLDENLKPKSSIYDSFPIVENQYQDGFLVGKYWYDVNYQLNKATTVTYDTYSGNAKEMCFLGSDGNLTVNDYGFSIKKAEYDQFNRMIKVEYFDENKKLVNTSFDYAYFTISYDDYGNESNISYYDCKNNLVDVSGSNYDIDDSNFKNVGYYASIDIAYNEKNNISQLKFYSQDGNLRSGDASPYSEHFAYLEYEYDSSYNIIENRYYDQNHNLMTQYEGYAVIKYQYDEQRRVIQKEYYNSNNQAVMINDYDKSYSKIVNTYSENANFGEESYYDLDGNLVE